MIERRKYPRFQLIVDANYKTINANLFKQGKTRNISAEGLCFESKEKFDIGTQVSLEVDLGDNMSPVNLVGEIRWSQEAKGRYPEKKRFVNGVRLIDIAKSDENRFLKYYCTKMVEKLSGYLNM